MSGVAARSRLGRASTTPQAADTTAGLSLKKPGSRGYLMFRP